MILAELKHVLRNDHLACVNKNCSYAICPRYNMYKPLAPSATNQICHSYDASPTWRDPSPCHAVKKHQHQFKRDIELLAGRDRPIRRFKSRKGVNSSNAEVIYLNFNPLEVVSRYLVPNFKRVKITLFV